MATCNPPTAIVGYECDFVDKVPEDYFCKRCKHVAKEPTLASCCTEIFCKVCIDYLIEKKWPCSSCEKIDICIMGLHKKYRSMILALRVKCLNKGHGCRWTGQLEHLESHLDITTGGCVMEACPNMCGATFEPESLEEHLKECSLQKMECVFKPLGCNAEFEREKLETHLEQTINSHLMMTTASTIKLAQNLQIEFEQKLEEKDAEIKALKEQLDELKTNCLPLINQVKYQKRKCVPPYDIKFSGCKERKAKGEEIESQPMYTHPGGYKFKLVLNENYFFPMLILLKSEDELVFPVQILMMLVIVNQHTDDHYEREVTWKVYGINMCEGTSSKNEDLESKWKVGEQYLKNDCMQYKITKINISN